jgi:hypothetical protein
MSEIFPNKNSIGTTHDAAGEAWAVKSKILFAIIGIFGMGTVLEVMAFAPGTHIATPEKIDARRSQSR